MFKANNIKTPERRHWHRSDVFIVNFEHISHLVLMFQLLTLSRQMPTGTRLTQKQRNVKNVLSVKKLCDIVLAIKES